MGGYVGLAWVEQYMHGLGWSSTSIGLDGAAHACAGKRTNVASVLQMGMGHEHFTAPDTRFHVFKPSSCQGYPHLYAPPAPA